MRGGRFGNGDCARLREHATERLLRCVLAGRSGSHFDPARHAQLPGPHIEYQRIPPLSSEAVVAQYAKPLLALADGIRADVDVL